MTGYASAQYVGSLAEFGVPLALPRCNGWLLKRTIADSALSDAMGAYPLFCCEEWGSLLEDLTDATSGMVSLGLVVDLFAGISREALAGYFQQVIHYKDHFVVDLNADPESFISSHHRYYSRRAAKNITVEVVEEPFTFLEQWCALYEKLVERHQLKGLKAFSRGSFEKQFATPGLAALKARAGNEVVGGHLWFVQGDVAYSHLASSNDIGYRFGASYALYWEAIQYFRGRVRWLNIGAGAGVKERVDDG